MQTTHYYMHLCCTSCMAQANTCERAQWHTSLCAMGLVCHTGALCMFFSSLACSFQGWQSYIYLTLPFSVSKAQELYRTMLMAQTVRRGHLDRKNTVN